MLDNSLVQDQGQEIVLFRLELLVEVASNNVSYNQIVLPYKVIVSPTGTALTFDPIKERKVAVAYNNKDNIKRETLQDDAFILYSIVCSQPRIAEFKEALVTFAKDTESNLLKEHQKQVDLKTSLVAELETYLVTTDVTE